MARKTAEESRKEELEAIKLWKELKIKSITFTFDCGGDSMGNTDFNVFTEKEDVDTSEIVNYFEDEIYRKVQFYEVSDGEYIGESGSVYITLIEDGGESPYFLYDKQSESEWNLSFSNTMQVQLSQKEAEFINAHVRSMQGSNHDTSAINYKDDFILSDEDEKMLDTLIHRILNEAADFKIEDEDLPDDADESDWYSFDFINIDGTNVMHVEVTKSFSIIKQD